MRDRAARLSVRATEGSVELLSANYEQPIHRGFERHAAHRPNAPAIRLAVGDISYRELNDASNQAARRLLRIIPDDRKPVALLFDQGYQSILWTLAILKAGLCYAPLDARLPPPVLRRIFDHLGPAAVVAGVPYMEIARTLAAADLPLIDAAADHEQASSANLDRTVAPTAIACIFYTSGSTGAPKGVADCHRNVLHNILRYTDTLKFAPGDTLSLVQNPSFSGTVSTLFGALLSGAAVAPINLRDEGLPALSPWLRRTGVTVFHAVPSIFRQLADPVDRFPAVRLVRLEGDRASALDIQHFRAHFSAHCTLVNGLGATECGLVRQFFINQETSFARHEPVPIGYPVPGVTVRIVDASGATLPPEATGEIAVESEYLAVGYWRDPTLTAEKFLPLAGTLRRYRSGDLGRMDGDGCLMHLGRLDHRLRIAGEFIDPSAIEGPLIEIAGISQCVVREFDDEAGERRLCAYVVAERSVTVTELRQALSERLAPALLPSAFVFLAALPLTKDHKVDYRQLPQPSRARPPLPAEYAAPEGTLERQLAQLWSEVLEIDEIGALDSFFDLGGDSLRAARLAVRLKERHGLELPVMTLFEQRTVRAVARSLQDPQPHAIEPRDEIAEPGGNWPDHSIAIIGMAGRFPGAETLEAFWENLRAGRESITLLSTPGARPHGAAGSDPVAARGFLADVDQFDAALFRLTPRQAQLLDPQQRVWLECVHRALEDAGIPLDESGLAGANRNIGVFVGGAESSYLWHLAGGNQEAVNALVQRSNDEAHQLMISNDSDSIATRTSFVFDLQGPSINVQSACSTSLVAIAQACQALASGTCGMAVAGGVALSFPQEIAPRTQHAGIHSHDGHCRAFDAAASGTVFSDGAGAVVLKRLADALADGDRVDAVIRGWSVNNDGSKKASFAAPSVSGQTAAIVRAQEHGRVRPDQIGYIEAHGTATPVGDAIEFAALERAFRRATGARRFCALGAVKANIGHLDTAAGVAGLIKTALVLRHGEIPPLLHFNQVNPEIDLDNSPFYIANAPRVWNSAAARIAGVSSFGVGGTNCHMIVEEAPRAQTRLSTNDSAGYLLTLSAASEKALEELEAAYGAFLAQHADADVAAVAATTQRSRSHYVHRTAIVGKTPAEMSARLAHYPKPAQFCWRGHARRDRTPKIGFLFAGQGSQYAGMGKALYAAHREFRLILEHCDAVLRAELERPLLEVMFAGPDELLSRTEYAQPALFALEYGLAQLLRSWGIEPRFVMGHSIGEYVAACLAGVFGLETGLVLIARRGRLMRQLCSEGKMLAVIAPEARIEPILAPFANRVSIAAINAPTRTVLSGESGAIEQLKSALAREGFYCRELAVSHGFHSALMNPVLAALRDLAAVIDLQPPRLSLFSSLHGRAVTSEVTDPNYWRDQAREPVQCAAGLRAMIEAGCELFIEMGPERFFSDLADEIAANAVVSIPTLRRGQQDWSALLETLAQLYTHGARIDWPAFHNGHAHRPLHLPPYPFQRQRHWYDGALMRRSGSATAAPGQSSGHPLLGRRLRLPGCNEIRFETRFSQTAPHYLTDHRLFGVSLPPAASHLSMLAQVAQDLSNVGAECLRFEDLFMLRPLLLPDGRERDVQLILRPQGQGWALELTSAPAGEHKPEWTVHMTGLCWSRSNEMEQNAPVTGLEDLKQRCSAAISSQDFYSRIWSNQGGTGAAFRWIDSIWRGQREALCRATCPTSVADAPLYRLHPGLIEAACQVLHCCETFETAESLNRGETFVPFSVGAFMLFDARAQHGRAWCHAQLRDHDDRSVLADLSILNEAGELVARIENFCLRPITRAAIEGAQTAASRGAREGSLDYRPAANAPVDNPPASPAGIARYLQLQCAELSGYPEAQIATDLGFIDLGLDSIIAMMLANRIRQDFGAAIPVIQILLSKKLELLAIEIWRSISR